MQCQESEKQKSALSEAKQDDSSLVLLNAEQMKSVLRAPNIPSASVMQRFAERRPKLIIRQPEVSLAKKGQRPTA